MKYNITFVDTCIISQALQNKEVMRNFTLFIIRNKCLCGITSKTLSELHKSNSLFVEFHKYLNKFPFFLIKPKFVLVSDELKKIELSVPVHVSLNQLNFPMAELRKFTETTVRTVDAEFPKGAKRDIVDSIQNLKKNFPPSDGKKYSNDEINTFCEGVIWQKLNRYHPDFVEKFRNKHFDPFEFQSLKSQALITFWKFYKSSDRKIRDSDAFDISMSSCFPYMDIIISEKNMISDIKQIRKDKFAYENVQQLLTIIRF